MYVSLYVNKEYKDDIEENRQNKVSLTLNRKYL